LISFIPAHSQEIKFSVRFVMKNIFTLLILLFSPGWSATDAGSMIATRDGMGELFINEYAHYFKDTAAVLTPGDIASWNNLQWEQHPRLPVNLGYSRAPVWVRLLIADSSVNDRTWYLSLTQPQLDTVELYRVDDGDATLLGTAGRLCDRTGTAVIAREPAFVVPADKGRSVFLLRIRTTDVCAISLHLAQGKEYLRKKTLSYMSYGFYFGALAVVVFFNLFLFVTVRFVSCFWYSLWIIFLALFQASVSGHWGLLGIFPHWFVRCDVPVFLGSCVISAAAFSISFLGLREFSPVLWRSMQVLGGLGVLLILASPFGRITPAAIGSLLSGIFVLFSLIAGYASISHRGRPAVFYSCAITTFAFGIFLNVGRNFGILPNTILTTNGVLISSVIEVTIIAIALIDRIASIENEKTLAREKALLSERLATESRLKALQAQINPHFLFNTLNTIAEMTSIDPGKAEGLVTRLSRLFRNTLSASVKKSVLLSEELEMIKTYLEIEKERFGNRLDFTVEVQGDPSETYIVGLILQPIVENAVKHGIGPLPLGGRIHFLCRIETTKIYITVKDSGRGFGRSEVVGGTGYGLENVKERLRLAYGEAAAITCSNAEGAVVELSIPKVELS
jgi:two-component sensor histidine kinase